MVYNYYSSLQNSNFTLVNGNLATGQKATGVLGKPLGIPTGAKYNHNLHLSYKADSLFLKTSLTADAYYEKREDVFYVSFGRFDGGDGQSLAHNDKKGIFSSIITPDFANILTASPAVILFFHLPRAINSKEYYPGLLNLGVIWRHPKI